jgi:hypothetical protein
MILIVLNGEYRSIRFYYNDNNNNRRSGNYEDYLIKASNKPNHIVLNGKLHKIEVDEKEEIVPYTRKPRPRQKVDWDKRIKVLLTKFSNLKSQIEHFKKNDLQHLSVNLFVNPNLAEIVETNLNDTKKEIDKLEIETNSIQDYFENIEDQSTLQEIKQISSGKV